LNLVQGSRHILRPRGQEEPAVQEDRPAAPGDLQLLPEGTLAAGTECQAGRGRGPLAYRNVERRGLGRAADRAGLNANTQPRLRVHDLRHTFASHLIVDLRLDVAQVSRILGHARPSITLDT